jgi:signal peptidase I
VKFWKTAAMIQRFDLVEARVGVAKTPVVKRVVGLPGDTVSISFVDGEAGRARSPRAAPHTAYVVENRHWSEQVGEKTAPCCNPDGTAGTATTAVVVPADGYWLLGDNWGGSDDSRTYGFVKKADIGGVLDLRLQPLGSFGRVPNPARLVHAGKN